MRSVSVLYALAFASQLLAGETFEIAKFDKPEDLRRISWEAGNADVTVEPRLVTDFDKVMKFAVKQGKYPGFSIYPNKIPKDWSKYEALSFVVWTPTDIGFGLRIDDDKSTNFNTRFNGGLNLQKGRTLVQIPVKEIGKKINPSIIKGMTLFFDSPPKGLTLHFSDMKLGPIQSEKVPFIPYAERYDRIPSLTVQTPHLPLARNLAGGPIKTFMLSSVKYGREVEELMQRMDLSLSLLTWDREWGANTWGLGDHYGARGTGSDFALMQRYLDSSMQGDEKFEAMVLYTPVGWNRFTQSARQALIKRVKEDGAGLVLVMPFPGDKGQKWPDDLKELSALINSDTDFINDGGEMRQGVNGHIHGKKWVAAGDHPITRGAALEALPTDSMTVEKYELAPGAEALIKLDNGDPVLAVKTLGKGRVVTIATRALSLTPVMNTPRSYDKKVPYRFWETWYSLENRAIAWAAGRDLKRDGAPTPLTIDETHRDSHYVVNQWKNAEGKVTDWELVFTPPKNLPKRFDVKAPAAVKPGESITISATIPAECVDAVWAATLIENVGGEWRTLERALVKPADGKIALDLPSARVRQFIAVVKLEAQKNDAVIATGAAEVVVTPDPQWNDYEIHSWLESGLPFLADFEYQRMRDFGLTSNTVSPRDVNTSMQLFRHGMRVHANGLTNGLHTKELDAQSRAWSETKDRKNLIRHPSYSDTDFLAKEKANVAEHARVSMRFAPLSMIMSDETALTSYSREFDYDFHANNISAFLQSLKTQFESVEALNAALNTSFKSFDDIQPPTAEEARKSGNWGLFNAWRNHNDEAWTGAFTMYRKALSEIYPQTRLSLSGTQESAIFNGIDWARMSPEFGAICGYGGRFQELMRLSFHPGGLRATPWGGYGRSGRAVDHQMWTSLVTGGAGMGLFWWPSLRNPDLGFCKSGLDYQRVIAEMRGGVARQYMLSQRQFSPIAVYWSSASQRMAWTQGQFEAFKKVEADVLNTLHIAEFDPYFLSQAQLLNGELLKRGAKVLVLPMTLSLGTGTKKGGLAELPAIQKFMDAGGVVIYTHDALTDEFLQSSTLPLEMKAKWLQWSSVKSDLSAALAKYVAPHVTVRTANSERAKGVIATVHRLPGENTGALLTVLRAPIGMRDEVGADGVIRSVPDTSGGNQVEALTVSVPGYATHHIYDIRAAKILKAKNGIFTMNAEAGDGYPLALLPDVISEFKCTTAVRGRAIVVQWQVKSAAKTLAPHVIHLDILDAAGKPLPAFAVNVTSGRDGFGEHTIPLAEEDSTRTFTIRARDVLTGQTIDVKVQK